MTYFQVILFGHSPPGVFERPTSSYGSGHAWFDHKHNRNFVNMVRRHHKSIVAQFYGHQHTDAFKIFMDSSGELFGLGTP